MPDRPQTPDDNPFRLYSARNVLSRARERIQLIRHWLIRHDPPRDSTKTAQPEDPGRQR